MLPLEKQGSQSLERVDSIMHVYQPYHIFHKPFGRGRMAVYSESGPDKTGVDVVSILIENRNPTSGEFPKSDKGLMYRDHFLIVNQCVINICL